MPRATGRSEPIVLDFLVDEQPFSLALYPDEVGAGLTPRETGRLKQLAPGSAGLAMWQAITNLDAEVLAALCVLAVERSGQKIDAEKLFDGKVDWSLVAEDEARGEDAVDPLAAVDEAATADALPSITRTPAPSGHPALHTTSGSLRGA